MKTAAAAAAAVLLCLLSLLSCEDGAPASAPAYKDIDVAEFEALMKDSNTVILDVRTPPETALGIIAGAVEIDYNEPNFTDRLAELDTSKTYLVYCRSGRRSGLACTLMKERGFGTLYNLEGGYLDWVPKQKE